MIQSKKDMLHKMMSNALQRAHRLNDLLTNTAPSQVDLLEIYHPCKSYEVTEILELPTRKQ